MGDSRLVTYLLERHTIGYEQSDTGVEISYILVENKVLF